MTRIVRNAGFSLVSWAIPAAVALVSVPVIVRGLGAQAYGVLALVSVCTGYLALLEMGLGQAVLRQASIQAALGEGRSARELMRHALVWTACAGAFGGALLYLLSPWLIVELFHISQALYTDALIVFRLGALGFAFSLPTAVLAVVPQAFLRYDLAALPNSVVASLSNAGPALLVLVGYRITAIAVFGLALNVAALVIYGAIALRLIAELPGDTGAGWSTFRPSIVRMAGLTAAARAHGVLAQQTAKLVVGAAGGVALAGYYNVTFTLADRLNDMTSRVGQVLFPHGAHMVARGEHASLSQLYLRSSRILFALNAAVSCSIVVFAEPLLRYWVNAELANLAGEALALLALAQVVNAASIPASLVNLANDKPSINLWFSFANSIINLVLVYPLTSVMGLTGTAAAALAGSVVVPFFIRYSQQQTEALRGLKVSRAYVPALISFGVVSLIGRRFLAGLPENLLGTLAMSAALTVLVIGFSGVMGAISVEDLKAVAGRGGVGNDAR